MIHTTEIKTPLGIMRAAATDEGICIFDFQYRKSMDSIMKRVEVGLNDKLVAGGHKHFEILQQQMEEYFTGQRKDFTVPLHIVGSPFQKRVWNALLQIPYGETRSYEQQSLVLGDVKAIRAVAGANGENGIAIIVPCHRVIGKNGSLTGYGGGLPNKKWLLEHEWKHAGKSQQISLSF